MYPANMMNFFVFRCRQSKVFELDKKVLTVFYVHGTIYLALSKQMNMREWWNW